MASDVTRRSSHLWALVLLVITNGVLVVSSERLQSKITKRTRNAFVDLEARNNVIIVNIRKDDGEVMLNSLHTREDELKGLTQPLVMQPSCGLHQTCFLSGNVSKTVIETDPSGNSVKVSRVVNKPSARIADCFKLNDDTEWFGGPQQRYQHWPIQHMYYEEVPYVPTHPINMAITERYWLSSKGVYIFASEKDPLFLDQNNYKDKHLCLVAQNKSPYRQRDLVTLNYEIGVFVNPRIAHEDAVKRHLGKPTGRPDERMIKYPIWSTWARYKINVNEQVVDELANEILAYKFPNSQLEIDDNWETCYGSAVFDPKKFPNVTRMTSSLKKKGFRVTLWIHPFVNNRCEPTYSSALKNGYFVKNLQGKVQMQWWQGSDAATVDFTNPKAVQWWVGRLKNLVKLGIDSFKFDAGEISWLPQVPSLIGPLDQQPGIFTKDYVNALAKNFGNAIEVRVGWRSQNLPVFVRMIDKDTRWTWNNGIPTLITTLLQMNLNGYVHVLPDMIGGNGYLNNSFNGTVYPPKELFIRWLQANVFMPSLQYSFVPWDFDNETVQISKKFTDLHAMVTPTILRLMNAAVQTGAPLNPPIWWVDPTNRIAHKVNDEYLLGQDILVAPVIEEGATSRDVYLPAGRWKDANSNTIYTGPVWLRNYPAPLSVLPYFVKA
ncbi:myogenesis-regulating glycosidase [Orussus abietinus]|uniref:myogenesis-regulating glycosidase n=1 Tax=Orussus abietinus TaxID=222816 RepID=UPI0006268752|nr:myogenesis-regulating glycosidase [Orussus abietinus]